MSVGESVCVCVHVNIYIYEQNKKKRQSDRQLLTHLSPYLPFHEIKGRLRFCQDKYICLATKWRQTCRIHTVNCVLWALHSDTCLGHAGRRIRTSRKEWQRENTWQTTTGRNRWHRCPRFLVFRIHLAGRRTKLIFCETNRRCLRRGSI